MAWLFRIRVLLSTQIEELKEQGRPGYVADMYNYEFQINRVILVVKNANGFLYCVTGMSVTLLQ